MTNTNSFSTHFLNVQLPWPGRGSYWCGCLLALILCAWGNTGLMGQAKTPDFAPKTGFWVSGSGGLYSGAEAIVKPDFSWQAGLDYERPLGKSISLLGGFGLQQRSTQGAISVNVPCDFPLGDKVVRFLDNERYRTDELEAYAKFGATWRWRRWQFGLAAVPAYRLSNQLNYRSLRNFSAGPRPDVFTDVTVRSGETIITIDGEERSVRYARNYNIQATLTAHYLLTPRLRLGASYQPMLTGNDVEFGERFTCDDGDCGYFPIPEKIFSARVHTVFVNVGYQF